jgi:hypothetical protein
MLFSVDCGTVDAPSYPAIAVWANPAKSPDACQNSNLPAAIVMAAGGLICGFELTSAV